MSSIQEEKDSINHSPIHIEKQSNTRSNSLPNLPSKLWDIKDTFKYAPPKPEGDAWALLLDPLIKKDRVQCDAWKDEVQNLLIFAGLFSAVVTTFIAESYKNLQADPNDTIVGLLSQIASQTDRSLNTTTVKWEPANSFVPTSSSIRVNVFWFISLVLSLATVVIGIVSLQWLREHQAYESDLSSREKYALYNMRADGIKKWHVDKIFTSLPLLLQSALVLFLGGIIDFLHAIGYWAVTIPVAVVISFILLFLIATTLLPCLQVLSLYVYFPRRNGTVPKFVAPPSQCPYKSPQSHAVRRIFISVAQLYDRVAMLHIPRLLHQVMHYLRKPFTRSAPFQPGYYSFHPFTVYLGHAARSHWWGCFDLAWLNIRDAYMRRLFGQQLDFGGMLGQEDYQIFPTYDIVMGLLSQNDEKSTAIPAYHCFDEISLMRDNQRWYRQYVYLYRLVANGFELEDDTCLADFSL
uniref:DUF6535 domain-containing protein n=1 Tax=Psilocybe cubensis TaxID=181762 RepID=A0A8H8CKU6_PSICU